MSKAAAAVIPVLATLVMAACSDGSASTTATMATSTTISSAPTSTVPPIVECPGVGEFEEGRGIADMPAQASDSRTIGRISWETSDQCETIHFDFETSEGAPATTPPSIRVDHLDSFQVVRISLDVDSTLLTDQLVETELLDRLYVVRSLSGGMFVDLHLADPAAVRVATSTSPARLSVELRPGFAPFAGSSALGERVVLTSPVSGSSVTPSAQFLGYARTSESNVDAIVTQGGEVAVETSTTSADSTGAWGEYRLRLDLPVGDVEVFIGEQSPDDGSLNGVTLDLTVG